MSNVITIDGPVSSGKNTVGLLFARKIGYQFIDTGSIYRAGTYLALKLRIPLEDDEDIVKVFQNLEIDFQDDGREIKVIVNGKDLTNVLHTPEVTALVATIAAKSSVRDVTKKIQMDLGKKQNTVMMGRDIGSEIFPDAPLKFFITASAEVRAKRRLKQLHEQNIDISLERIIAEINARDNKDSTRAASPFRMPEGAIVIDTSSMDINESVEELTRHFKNSGLS